MALANRSDRAGKYMLQSTGYSAFIPEPLPPEDLVLDDETLALLSKADRALGRLDGSVYTLPDADLFISMYIKKEAVLSSQIEGTQSSLHDLLSVEANLFRENAPKDVEEVIDYISAMNYGIQRLEDLPVSTRLIKEIHARLLKHVRGSHLEPGELRRSQNWIGPAGCTLATASYVPPPNDQLPELLSALERFIHADDNLPALVKIALTHAQFESIHPFLDGNGRLGRLLITFLLIEQEILMKPVLYISTYFKQRRQEYYDRFQAIRDDGSWEQWLKFFLEGIIEVSAEASETAREILALRERDRSAITGLLGSSAGNGIQILETLYKTPIVTVNRVRDLLDVTFASANNLVSKLVELGILQESTGNSRNRRFFYKRYMELFSSI